MMERMKFYLMNGRDAMTRICFRVKNKTGNNITSGFLLCIRLSFIYFTDLYNLSCSTYNLLLLSLTHRFFISLRYIQNDRIIIK